MKATKLTLIKLSIKPITIGREGITKKGIAIFYSIADFLEFLKAKRIEYDIEKIQIRNNKWTFAQLNEREIWPNRSVVDCRDEPFELVVDIF